MNKMKQSKVEWIGVIPEEWEVKEISKLFSQRNTKVSDFDFPPLSVTKQGIVPQLESAAKSDDHTNRKLVKKGDFVINSRSDRKMSSGVSEFDGSVSLINLVMIPKPEKLSVSFVKYLLKNYGFAEEFYRWGTGIVDDLWSTNWERGKKIQLPIPPISEQQRIAKFLDEKTALIDDIITDTKQTIEELKSYKQSLISEIVTKGINKDVKLVSSGIEWIGEIPKGWKTIPLKLVFNEIGSGTTPDTSQSEFYGDKIYWIQSGDLYQKKYVEDTKKKISDKGLNSSSALKIYKSPFIAVAMYGASIGNVSISKIDSCVNQAVAVMSNPILLELEFAYYCLFISKEFLILESKGGTQPNISQEILKNWKIPLPTVDEQKMIIEILDKKTNQIDMIIKEKENLISEYENYKKSMIYEYVTGKKRVEGYES